MLFMENEDGLHMIMMNKNDHASVETSELKLHDGYNDTQYSSIAVHNVQIRRFGPFTELFVPHVGVDTTTMKQWLADDGVRWVDKTGYPPGHLDKLIAYQKEWIEEHG